MLREQNKVLATAAGEIDIDELEELQDEAADLMADMSDINDVLTRDYSGISVDEATLNEELAGLDSIMDSIPDAAPAVGTGAMPIAAGGDYNFVGAQTAQAAYAPYAGGGAAAAYAQPAPPASAPATAH